MSDFESRVRAALSRGADGAPDVVGLADAARQRRDRRRRTTGVVLAAAFAVAAVPVGLALVADDDNGSGDRGGDTVATQPTGSAVPEGRRVYSYGDATALVPSSWAPGGVYRAGDWCNGTKRPESGPVGFVGRFFASTLMFCEGDEPLSNYQPFASFSTEQQGPARAEVEGWVTENVKVGSVWLTVRSDDPAQLEEIKRSATVIDGVDANGCAPTHVAMTDTDWRPEPNVRLPDSEPVDRLVACAYAHLSSGDGGPTLLRSDSYRGEEASQILGLVLDAEAVAPTEEACMVSAASYTLLTAHVGDKTQQIVVRSDYCHGLGSDDGFQYRADAPGANMWLEYGSKPPNLEQVVRGLKSSGPSVSVDPEAPDAPGS